RAVPPAVYGAIGGGAVAEAVRLAPHALRGSGTAYVRFRWTDPPTHPSISTAIVPYGRDRMFKLVKRVVFAVGIVLLGLVWANVILRGVGGSKRSYQTYETPTPVAESRPASVPAKTWTPTAQEKADREKLIEKLQQQNVFGDVRVANNVGKVVVGP